MRWRVGCEETTPEYHLHFLYSRSRDDSRAQNTIVLPGWQISAASDEVKRPFALKLSHEGMPAYFFAAETEDDFNTWLEVSMVVFVLVKIMLVAC